MLPPTPVHLCRSSSSPCCLEDPKFKRSLTLLMCIYVYPPYRECPRAGALGKLQEKGALPSNLPLLCLLAFWCLQVAALLVLLLAGSFALVVLWAPCSLNKGDSLHSCTTSTPHMGASRPRRDRIAQNLEKCCSSFSFGLWALEAPPIQEVGV